MLNTLAEIITWPNPLKSSNSRKKLSTPDDEAKMRINTQIFIYFHLVHDFIFLRSMPIMREVITSWLEKMQAQQKDWQ